MKSITFVSIAIATAMASPQQEALSQESPVQNASTSQHQSFSDASSQGISTFEDEGAKRYPSFVNDLSRALPLPTPDFDPSRFTLPSSTEAVSYDTQTGIQTVQDIRSMGLPEEAFTVGWNSDSDDQDINRRDLWGGDLSAVDSDVFPWGAQCRLVFDDPTTGLTYVCSGTLISARVVITAGHCVHKGDGSTWYTNYRVIPAWDGDDSSYGSSNAAQLTTFTGWSNNADYNHDMGFIRLDRPVGFLSGWFGYGYSTNDGFYSGNTFNLAGYPGGCYQGAPDQLYYGFGDYDVITQYILTSDTTWSCNTGGVSGSGVYWINSGVRYVHGVHSHRCYGCNPNTIGHTRLESGKYNYLATTYMPGSYPDTSADYLPLDVNARTGRYSNVTAGFPLSSMDYQVSNESGVNPGPATYSVDVYLSTNDNISTSDTLLQSHTFSWDFSALSSVRVTVSVPPTIPSSTPTGTYWVGVIVSGPGDPDASNNDSDGWDAAQISVVGCEVSLSTFGQGYPGSGGFVPSLTGVGSSCANNGHRVDIGNGLGGASGLLFVGVNSANLSPSWGGSFYVDLSQAWISVPLTLAGGFGVPGAGNISLPGTDKRGFQGLSLYLQGVFLDPGAARNVSSTNGLILAITE